MSKCLTALFALLDATAAWRDSVSGFVIDGLSYYRFEDVKIKK